MTQYNTLNAKLSTLQHNKLKLEIKIGTEITLKPSSSVVSDSNDDTNFPHELLITNTQVLRLCKTFANGSSAHMKLSKTQLHKIGESGIFFGRLLWPLLKTGLFLMKNLQKPLAKLVWMTSGLTAVASATAAAQNKIFGFGTTTLIISMRKWMFSWKLLIPIKNLVY